MELVAGFSVELAAEHEELLLLLVAEQRLRRQQELPRNRHPRRSHRRRPSWSCIDEVVEVEEADACLARFGAFLPASTLSPASDPSDKIERDWRRESPLIEQCLRKSLGRREVTIARKLPETGAFNST